MRLIQLRQERDFGQKINATFQFVGQNFKSLLTILLYTVVPFALIGGILQALMQFQLQKTIRDVTGSGDYDRSDPVGSLMTIYTHMFETMFTSPYTLLSMLFNFLTGILLSISVLGFMIAYDESTEEPISVNTVINYIKKNVLTISVSTIVCLIIAAIGFILFLIPGFYLVVVFSLVNMIIIREGTGVFDSIGRAFRLISGKWWSTFGLICIIGICIWMITIAISIPLGIVSALQSYKSVQSGEVSIGVLAITSLTQVFSNLATAILHIALGFQYFNLVEKKDGLGLQQQINQIGQQTKSTDEDGEY
ncbi:MAG: hypothetical protein U0Y10_05525 [Spirosomataceae bacterium]